MRVRGVLFMHAGKPGKPDVITLQFDNAVDDKGVKAVEYMEGHYLYLCCPAVETSTWNGFQACMCSECAAHVQCTCTCTCTCSAHVCACACASAVHTQCPCYAYAVQMQCTCTCGACACTCPCTCSALAAHLPSRPRREPASQEFHPFTISSAPDEPVLEVNIRVMPSPYSWTNKVARYLQLLDPNNTGEVELVTRNPTTGVTTLGKVVTLPLHYRYITVTLPLRQRLQEGRLRVGRLLGLT